MRNHNGLRDHKITGLRTILDREAGGDKGTRGHGDGGACKFEIRNSKSEIGGKGSGGKRAGWCVANPFDTRECAFHGVVEPLIAGPELAVMVLCESQILAVVRAGSSKLLGECHRSGLKSRFFADFNAEAEDDGKGRLCRVQVHLPTDDSLVKSIRHLRKQEAWRKEAGAPPSPTLGQPEGVLAVPFGHGPRGSQAGINDHDLAHRAARSFRLSRINSAELTAKMRPRKVPAWNRRACFRVVSMRRECFP